jgi:hypothetical protein
MRTVLGPATRTAVPTRLEHCLEDVVLSLAPAIAGYDSVAEAHVEDLRGACVGDGVAAALAETLTVGVEALLLKGQLRFR